MNILFLTQSITLKVFYDLMHKLKESHPIDNVGFFISDSAYFFKFLKETAEIESGNYVLVKEWEVMQRAEKNLPNIDKLKKYQEELKIPSLWEAIICDRRLIWGKNFTFRQDYKPRVDYGEAMSILAETFEAVEDHFDRVKPNFVVSFICTTVGEFVSYLVAKSRNIPFLNLRPTRVQNYMTFGPSVFEPSDLIKKTYEDYRNEKIEDEWTKKAEEYLSFVKEQHARYEGVFLPTQRPPQVGQIVRIPKKKAPLYLLKRFVQKTKNFLEEEKYYRFTGPKCDRHLPGALIPRLYRKFLNPRLVRKIDRYFSHKYIGESELENLDYVFYPLHTEPEVTLLVYSKPYLNQIEVIRNLAYSLPAGQILIVKEHPAARGKRPLGFYKKIEDIFNVRFVDPTMDARSLIIHSKLVATIASSVGFEAVLLGKPVLTFGQTPYEILPSHMVRRIKDLNTLSETVRDMMENHFFDEEALVDYLAAVMCRSVPIDFYTTLLERKTQLSFRDSSDWQRDIGELAKYTMSIYKSLSNETSSRSHKDNS